MLQVTVIAHSATDSDALSNVLFVLGPKASAPILQKLPQVSVLILSGQQPLVTCNLLGWSAGIYPGYCSSITTASEVNQ